MPKQIMSTEAAASNDENAPNGTSRRWFLGALGLGIAGAAAIAGFMPFGRRDRTAEAANEFPGPGSIFHPAQDPRSDPRR